MNGWSALGGTNVNLFAVYKDSKLVVELKTLRISWTPALALRSAMRGFLS
jgi:hypothetical protein